MNDIDVSKKELNNIASDGYEVLIDEVIENGALKDIPIVRTAVSMYRAGRHLIDEHNIKKL